ncbi:MAG: pyridoxal-phosphate dependent enzyme [Nitrospiraceae bacterium]
MAPTWCFSDNYDEACRAAMERSRERHATFIHPFDDDEVIAGQGTLGLELLRQNQSLDVIVVPVGGGGLIGGVGCAVKEQRSAVEVVGVQTARLPSMSAAPGGHPVELAGQSDGGWHRRARQAGSRTLPLVQRYVDQIVVDLEDEIGGDPHVARGEKTVAEARASRAGGITTSQDGPSREKHCGACVRRKPGCEPAGPSSEAWCGTVGACGCVCGCRIIPARSRG